MTGRSNSATTSRMMWMLSASSARRWSSRRSVVTSGDKATVDIVLPLGRPEGRPLHTRWSTPTTHVVGADVYVGPKQKSPGFLSRASFQLFVFLVLTQTAGPLAPGPTGSSYN